MIAQIFAGKNRTIYKQGIVVKWDKLGEDFTNVGIRG